MKILKRILGVLLITLAIFQIALQINKSKAANIGDVEYLERENKGYYSIQKWNGSDWIYVTYSITHYIDEQGIKQIAYCIDPDLKGIGWISGEYQGYDVKLKEVLSDEKLWRVYTNGYPYKTATELGLETDEDAYLATKQASYCILRSYSLEDIRKLYRAGETKVEGESLEDIKSRGNKVIDAICNLVDIGYNGTETPQYNNLLSINKVGEFAEDVKDKEYYSQLYEVKSKVECNNYKIENITGFTEDSYITNIDGVVQSEFCKNEKFKIMVPKSSIKDDIEGTINISVTCKNCPIYYGECMVGNYQNYMICCDKYSDNIKASTNLKIEGYKSKLEINKIDADTKNPMSAVEFSVKYEDGTDLGIFATDKNGKIEISNLKQGNIIVTETKTKNDYILDSKSNYLKLQYNECQNITLENKKKKGAIRIIKVDFDNNEIRIKGVQFEIYNEKNELINTVTTDENGEAKIENLPINSKYVIKEIKAKDDYILSDESITIELNENEIKNITFKNKKKEAEIKDKVEEKLPRTGCIDISNYLLGMSIVGSTLNVKLKKRKNI